MIVVRLYLISYDIACRRRWRRVQKALRRLCQREQLSVFVCRGTPARLAALQSQLQNLLHPQEDRLMVLDLGPAGPAAEKLKSINPISRAAELEGTIL